MDYSLWLSDKRLFRLALTGHRGRCGVNATQRFSRRLQCRVLCCSWFSFFVDCGNKTDDKYPTSDEIVNFEDNIHV